MLDSGDVVREQRGYIEKVKIRAAAQYTMARSRPNLGFLYSGDRSTIEQSGESERHGLAVDATKVEVKETSRHVGSVDKLKDWMTHHIYL